MSLVYTKTSMMTAGGGRCAMECLDMATNVGSGRSCVSFLVLVDILGHLNVTFLSVRCISLNLPMAAHWSEYLPRGDILMLLRKFKRRRAAEANYAAVCEFMMKAVFGR